MKAAINKTVLLTAFILFLGVYVMAYPLPPGHGHDDDQQPAPIGSGLAILMALGAAYGAKKVYNARRKFNG